VAIGDLNRDGRPDLVVANQSANTVSVLLGTGTGSFGTAANFSVGANPTAVAVGDFDEDGRPDLVIANPGAADVSLLRNTSRPPIDGGGGGDGDGDGCFIATAAYGSPLAPQVRLLREVRDQYLLPYRPGRAAVRAYYALSPPLADAVRRSAPLRVAVRVALTPLLGWAAIMLWAPPVGLGLTAVPIVVGVLLVGRRRRHP